MIPLWIEKPKQQYMISYPLSPMHIKTMSRLANILVFYIVHCLNLFFPSPSSLIHILSSILQYTSFCIRDCMLLYTRFFFIIIIYFLHLFFSLQIFSFFLSLKGLLQFLDFLLNSNKEKNKMYYSFVLGFIFQLHPNLKTRLIN